MSFRVYPLVFGPILAFLGACGSSGGAGNSGADASSHDGNGSGMMAQEAGGSSSPDGSSPYMSPDGSVYDASSASDGTAVPPGPDAASPDSATSTADSSTPPGVGATTTFASYEGENGTLGGGATVMALKSPPTTEYSSAELEASGHAFANLAKVGQYVEWTNKTGQNITFVNVRYSVPDSATGGGIESTLNLYINGTMRQSLNVSSKQTWLYEGGNNNYNENDQNPADGDPRVFWDEVSTFLTGAALAPGDTIRLQMDADNTASYYNIDVIDIEAPPPPITMPAGDLSITTCGAVAGPSTDSTTAIQNCINMAQTSKQAVWIPQGTFYLNGSRGLQANGITIEGAGMWYSTIYRNVPLPNNVGLAATFSVTSCTVRNFATDANAISRATVDGCGGAMDTTGTNWVADSIWTKHAESGFWASGTGGTLENNRLGPMWADGINLNNVSLTGTVGNNLTAKNNFVRGTGDDAIAINSVNTNPGQTYTPMANVTVENNTSIGPWGGKGVAIYGGGGHVVKNNYMSDTARYIGLGVGKFGANGSDLTSAMVTGNVVERCGGDAYVQGQPAMMIGNGGDGQSVGTVENATVSNNTIINSLYDSVGFSTSVGIIFENNTITSPWRNGIVIDPPFYPAPTGSATITGNTVTGLAAGNMAFINNSSGYTVTMSGNSW